MVVGLVAGVGFEGGTRGWMLIHDSVFTVSPASDTIGMKPLAGSEDKCRKCWLLGPPAILVGL